MCFEFIVTYFYRLFLDDLHDEFAKHNLKLGTVIAAWGILQVNARNLKTLPKIIFNKN